MKTWLFALLQSIIAVLGLAAYFLADNLYLVTVAAVLAALVGIAQPLISAHKGRKLEIYQDRQYQKSLDSVDGQLQGLFEAVIDPPPPHRATVAVVLRDRFGPQADSLLDQYDHLLQSISAGDPKSASLAAAFARQVAPSAIGAYLQGLAALAGGDLPAAHDRFSAAKEQQSGWIAPWLGWATTSYRQGRLDDLRERHPHLCGVELLPYDAGDERTFLQLDEPQREALAGQFQQAATSLGNYYTIAEFCRSKQQMATSQAEFKQVA